MQIPVEYLHRQKMASSPDFIRKLYSMIQESPQIISFSEDGIEVMIHDYHKFVSEMLPKYFRHNKWRSFIRQMNMYNFRKINRGMKTYIFMNNIFRRGNQDHYHKIRRKINLKDEEDQNERGVENLLRDKLVEECQDANIAHNPHLLNSVRQLANATAHKGKARERDNGNGSGQQNAMNININMGMSMGMSMSMSMMESREIVQDGENRESMENRENRENNTNNININANSNSNSNNCNNSKTSLTTQPASHGVHGPQSIQQLHPNTNTNTNNNNANQSLLLNSNISNMSNISNISNISNMNMQQQPHALPTVAQGVPALGASSSLSQSQCQPHSHIHQHSGTYTYTNSLIYFIQNILEYRNKTEQVCTQIKQNLQFIIKERKTTENRNIFNAVKDSILMIEEVSSKIKDRIEDYVHEADEEDGDGQVDGHGNGYGQGDRGINMDMNIEEYVSINGSMNPSAKVGTSSSNVLCKNTYPSTTSTTAPTTSAGNRNITKNIRDANHSSIGSSISSGIGRGIGGKPIIARAVPLKNDDQSYGGGGRHELVSFPSNSSINLIIPQPIVNRQAGIVAKTSNKQLGDGQHQQELVDFQQYQYSYNSNNNNNNNNGSRLALQQPPGNTNNNNNNNNNNNHNNSNNNSNNNSINNNSNSINNNRLGVSSLCSFTSVTHLINFDKE